MMGLMNWLFPNKPTCRKCGATSDVYELHDGWMCEGCLDAMLAAIIQKELKEKPKPVPMCTVETMNKFALASCYCAPPRTDVDRLMDAARRDVAANERRRRAAK
jgi:hypothetical protein